MLNVNLIKSTDRTTKGGGSLASLFFGVFGAIIAFTIIQGYQIGIGNFFTPLHHDDFSAFAFGPSFNFLLPRPVSSNFIYVLGSYGIGFYYIVYLLLCGVALSLTVMTVQRMFRINIPLTGIALSTFSISLAWLSIASSVASFQYLGLSTNLLSYVLAMAAAYILLANRLDITRVSYFGILLFLAAFAKEDMAVFICGVIVLRGVRDLDDGDSFKTVLSRTVALVALTVATYTLSLLHSSLNGSPFTAGTGFYDMSSPLQNVINNTLSFLRASTAMLIVVVVHLIGIVALIAQSISNRRWSSLGHVTAALLPLSVALPYVLLPRFADYYAISFIPMMIACWAPIGLILFNAKSVVAAVITSLALPASASLLFGAVDHKSFSWQMGWYNSQREKSRNQMQELQRAYVQGLSKCTTVAVLGVSSELGPFMNGTANFVDRFLGQEFNWRIMAEKGTVLGNFAQTLQLGNPNWSYFISDVEAANSADCLLKYDERGFAELKLLKES